MSRGKWPTVVIKVFLTFFAWWQKNPDPDPYLWLVDPDPGGPKTCGSGSGTLGKSLVFLKLPNYSICSKFHSMPVGEQIVVSGPLLNMPLGRQSLSSPSSCSTFSYGPLSLLCRRVQEVVPILGISWLGPPSSSTLPPPLQISMRGGGPPLQFQVRELHDELSPLSGNSVVSSWGTSAAPRNSVVVWRTPPVVLASERSPVDSREARFDLSASCSTTDGRKSSSQSERTCSRQREKKRERKGRLLCSRIKGWRILSALAIHSLPSVSLPT